MPLKFVRLLGSLMCRRFAFILETVFRGKRNVLGQRNTSPFVAIFEWQTILQSSWFLGVTLAFDLFLTVFHWLWTDHSEATIGFATRIFPATPANRAAANALVSWGISSG